MYAKAPPQAKTVMPTPPRGTKRARESPESKKMPYDQASKTPRYIEEMGIWKVVPRGDLSEACVVPPKVGVPTPPAVMPPAHLLQTFKAGSKRPRVGARVIPAKSSSERKG